MQHFVPKVFIALVVLLLQSNVLLGFFVQLEQDFIQPILAQLDTIVQLVVFPLLLAPILQFVLLHRLHVLWVTIALQPPQQLHSVQLINIVHTTPLLPQRVGLDYVQKQEPFAQ